MPGGATIYGLNLLLDSLFGSGSPATLYVGLVTAEPDEDDDGSTISEPSGGSYARVAVTNDATNWPAAEFGQKLNGAAITFPAPTATWGTVTHVVVLDSATLGAGNLIAWARLSEARNILSGKTPWFDEGLLAFSISSLEV